MQSRRKWNYEQSPINVGDMVLLKNREVCRNSLSLGRVYCVFTSSDSRVRKVQVKVYKDGKVKYYTKPIVELVLPVKADV